MDNTASQIVDQLVQPQAQAQAPATQAPSQPPPQQTQAPAQAQRIGLSIRKEQELLAKERELRELEQRLKGNQSRIEEFDSVKTGNAKKALELLGLDYNQLTEALLKDGTIPPEVGLKKLEDKFDTLKSDFEKREEQRQLEFKRQAEENEKKAIQSFKSEITQYLSDNKTKYELIDFEQQHDLVFEVVDEHYNRTLKEAQKRYESGEIGEDQLVGKVLSIEEAADKVEQWLEQKYQKGKTVNKIKTIWGALPQGLMAEKFKTPQVDQSPQRLKPQTLTNQMSAMVATPRPNGRIISDDERIQKAIAYARSLRP